MAAADRGPGSGLDSAAAWAVRPFPRPALFPAVRTALQRLLADGGRFGIVPSEDWPDAAPWTAPTAWSAWSLAALGERRQALRLLGDLRRASTPAGLLPERVGARSGLPLSTTPLAWSHAFAILAIRQLWPGAPAYARAMEVRAATIADCEELARGMRSVVEEGRWLATESSTPAEDLEQRFRASVEWDGWFLFVARGRRRRSSARSACSRPRPTGCSRSGCGSCRSGAGEAAAGG